METIELENEKRIRIERSPEGIPLVFAETERDLYFGQGFAQMTDRGMQMLFNRIIGLGKISEHLASTDYALQNDLFFRKMNWRGDARFVVNEMSESTLGLMEAYVSGINRAMSLSVPWEFKYVNYQPDDWTVEDSIMLFRMFSYLSLHQTQREAERLLIEMVQAGVQVDYLMELFPGLLDDLDIELLKKIKLTERLTPTEISWGIMPPVMTASNNWVVQARKSATNSPLMAADPHMEINRLPNVWQQIGLRWKDRSMTGISLPGIPGVMMGRNNHLSWSATYSYMDTVDSWVEDCREGKCRRGSRTKTEWARFRERPEVIRRRQGEDLTVTFYENEHGVLDGDPNVEGYYLTTRWSASEQTGAKTFDSIFKIFHCDHVKEAMNLVGEVETSWNWLLADDGDNIGYQMSGLKPRRQSDTPGFLPRPGWDSRYDWKGFVPYKNLPRKYNPREGYIVTANNDLNSLGKTSPINISSAPYRAERLEYLLQAKKTFDFEDFTAMQYDDYSTQAQRYMEILRPLLPDTEAGKVLKDWDCRYHYNSSGAFLFEKFYHELILEVFGSGDKRRSIVEFLLNETPVFVSYFHLLDQILLSPSSIWFHEHTRDEIYERVLKRVLVGTIRKWGAQNRITMRNILLSGRLPRFLRIDRGPFVLSGGRATPNQLQKYRNNGRDSSQGASCRMVIDLSQDGLRINMPGGPLDRPFSRYYNSDTPGWLDMKYHWLQL